ncbi:hypothetical protein AVEN_188964-1 [Araneus ventricosus]|uniref:Reverse transcriptase domain-containing protein n=1 Tax=Araneus ventricosus TaxID=182803 RepID=A0A4Y2MWM2_ARAVE|nr:hypothetical protein AVEN_188964-1 [Araneus ventricosus]
MGIRFLLREKSMRSLCGSRAYLDPTIHIRNATFQWLTEIKFLGIIFDRKLTFLPHILHLRKNCDRSLNILESDSQYFLGADRTSLPMYKHILSCIDYGFSMVYGSCSVSPSYVELDTTHHILFSGFVSEAFLNLTQGESLCCLSPATTHLAASKNIRSYITFRALSVLRLYRVVSLTLPVSLRDI